MPKGGLAICANKWKRPRAPGIAWWALFRSGAACDPPAVPSNPRFPIPPGGSHGEQLRLPQRQWDLQPLAARRNFAAQDSEHPEVSALGRQQSCASILPPNPVSPPFLLSPPSSAHGALVGCGAHSCSVGVGEGRWELKHIGGGEAHRAGGPVRMSWGLTLIRIASSSACSIRRRPADWPTVQNRAGRTKFKSVLLISHR